MHCADVRRLTRAQQTCVFQNSTQSGKGRKGRKAASHPGRVRARESGRAERAGRMGASGVFADPHATAPCSPGLLLCGLCGLGVFAFHSGPRRVPCARLPPTYALSSAVEDVDGAAVHARLVGRIAADALRAAVLARRGERSRIAVAVERDGIAELIAG